MSTIGERPGVYTSYEVSTVYYSGSTSGTVGIAAVSEKQADSGVLDIVSYDDAVNKFGEDSRMTKLIKVLIKNGVAQIKAAALNKTADGSEPADNDYENALNKLAAQEDIKVIICDSTAPSVHGLMKNAILEADQRCAHKIGIVEGTGTVAELIEKAGNINSERIVMVGPAALDKDGAAAVTGSLAAAMAGAVVSGRDPAVPFNGAELFGIGGITQNYNDSEITSLIRGGVTPVECIGGSVNVVRGITTKTKAGDVTDYTYRELTTVMIIDDVIPAIRDSLKSRFARTKNTAQTRGAIRTHVIVKLEEKKSAEIIESYDNVTVSQDNYDPTVCNVTFDFTVTHGLNQIRLTAYITV